MPYRGYTYMAIKWLVYVRRGIKTEHKLDIISSIFHHELYAYLSNNPENIICTTPTKPTTRGRIRIPLRALCVRRVCIERLTATARPQQRSKCPEQRPSWVAMLQTYTVGSRVISVFANWWRTNRQTDQRTRTVILVQTSCWKIQRLFGKHSLMRLVSNYQMSEIQRTDTHRPENEQVEI